MIKRNLIFLIFSAILTLAYLQGPAIAQEHHSETISPHKVALVIGHTHVPKAGTGTQSSGIIVPSWGLDYDYWIDHQWAVGLQGDMEIATYVVEEHDNQEIERERPIILALTGKFKPIHSLVLLAGFGSEFDRHEKFWVIRFGIEYEFEIKNGWDLSPTLVYDIKESVYDSWSIGLAVGKRL